MTTGTPAYQLLEIAAAGTFGTVCIVRDLDRGNLLALKVLKETHLNRPRVIARTKDEALMLSQIHHPGIVRVSHFTEIERRPIIVMEWVRGLSLEYILQPRRHGLPVPESVEIVRQAALALGAAYHAVPDGSSCPMGIIHRDVKPSNMLLSVDGELKVVDFGIARGTFDGKQAQTLSMVLGARGYLAPERLDGQDDRPSCDIFSLGVVLYELITGRHMILSVHRAYHTQALDKHLGALQPNGLTASGARELRSIIADCCSYDEEHRPSHESLVVRLEEFKTRYDVRPNLFRWARSEVLPQFRDRRRTRPIDHPAYPQLAFLERAARMVKFPAPADVDQEIRIFLRRHDWKDHLSELDVVLLKNPHWSEAPFLERLPSGNRAWWQFWGGPEVPPDEIVTMLEYLTQRPTQAVLQRAEQLQRHPDDDVALAAHALLDRHRR